jgi:hypothetical protein
VALRQAHHSNAFSAMPGRCFRLVHEQGSGHATHCAELVVVRGVFTTPSGDKHKVYSCAGHEHDLTGRRPVSVKRPPEVPKGRKNGLPFPTA